ncbi:hypothetical protein D3C80_1799250 [compost metagenome]
MLPGLRRAGGDHVGVAGEAQHRTVAAITPGAAGPEVVHFLDAHRLQGETAGGQALHHQLHAVGIDRSDGGTADQLAGKGQGRREGHGEASWGRNGKGAYLTVGWC